MGYFDKVTEAVFKTNENGETIYYPNGVFGKGRIVPTPEVKEKLFKYQKRVNKYFGTVAVIYGMLLGLSSNISFESIFPIIFVYLFIFIRQRFLIRNLIVYRRQSVKEVSTTMSKVYKPSTLTFFMVNSICLISISFVIPFLFEQPIEEILFLILTPLILGVASLAIFLFLYKLQKSKK